METAPVDPRELETQLDRVLASATFRRAERSTALLGYLVRQWLGGHADRLKEYTIGADGLGRGASFDPRTDPIVRAEASRLRARLEQYYKTEGRSDVIVITLPKGSYVPRFSRRVELDERVDSGPARRFIFSPPLLALLGAVAAIGVALVGWRLRETPSSSQPVRRFEVELARDGELGAEVGPSIVLARNGERVVFSSRDAKGVSRLYTRRLRDDAVVRLPGTEGARDPFISADGQWVGFWSDGALRKVSARGGSPVVLCEMPGSVGASWGTDDTIVLGVTSSNRLWRLRERSAVPEPLFDALAESASPAWPQFLPGDELVLYTLIPSAGADAATIEVFSLRTGKRTVVQRNGTFGRYLANGYLTYVNQGTLYAVRFDPRKLAVEGDAVPLVEDVSYSRAFGYAEMDVSENGLLVYRRGAESGPFVAEQRDRSGASSPFVTTAGRYSWPRVSTDGRLALVATDRGTTAIRLYDPKTGEFRRVAVPTGEYRGLMWWPDGKSLVLAGRNGMTWVDLERNGPARPLTTSRSLQVPWSLSPDGHRLAYYEMSPHTGLDLWTVPITNTGTEIRAGTPERFLGTPAMEAYPSFSPDGQWIAYASNEAGRYEVYVRTFPDDGTKPVKVSRDDGSVPHWSRGGQELLYRTEDDRLMVAGYRIVGNRFVVGSHQAWPSEPLADTGVLPNFDLTPDGKHVVALMPSGPAVDRQAKGHVTMVVNVFEDVRQRDASR